jgi:N-glycosylase/DNA lyase
MKTAPRTGGIDRGNVRSPVHSRRPAFPGERLSPARLVGLHAERKDAIRARLAEFAAVPASEYFYELLFCLLTPQSSAANADRAVEILRERGFREHGFDPEPLLADRGHYVRFHRTKAARLLAARENFGTIAPRLENGSPPPELRAWLAGNVAGFGWKEASHFLRNIGRRDLAILDRHILKNLAACGVLRRLPKTLTPKRYLAIEKEFAGFADAVGIPMDELDLLFWSMETGQILK